MGYYHDQDDDRSDLNYGTSIVNDGGGVFVADDGVDDSDDGGVDDDL